VTPSSLAAAIEVKASPSSDKTAGGEYVKDIFALLWLSSEFDVSSYFVLLDKANALYHTKSAGQPLPAGPAFWMTDASEALIIRCRANKRQGRKASAKVSNLEKLGIDISTEKPQSDTPFVEVWTIDWSDGQEWTSKCRYATLKLSATNLHVAQGKVDAPATSDGSRGHGGRDQV
jgi:hypothetical protein